MDYWLARARRLLLRRLPAEEAVEVRRQVEEDGKLTERYVLMCALSAGIATLGLLQGSSAVVIGAMLVSPLMSPIASLGFAFASLDGRRSQVAARVLLVGASVGVAIGLVLTWLSPIRNATPEIIARTAPTLLDLAVAVLSGIAGGYATVHRRGETAIGVAIATALMPPLATLGYSIAVARFDFAMGALLLFLTNLAAIAFSFALVARLRGVARPLKNVEFNRVHVALGVVAFLALATPLTLTLRRVTQEAIATQAVRRELVRLIDVDPSQIAQLSVTWTNLGPPRVFATVVTPAYIDGAEDELRAFLVERFHAPAEVSLNQVVATDQAALTQAIVEAALGRDGIAGAAAVQAPIDSIRAGARVRVLQSWADASSRQVNLMAAPMEGWGLNDYRLEEARLGQLGFGWTVRLIPPYVDRIPISFDEDRSSMSHSQGEQIVVASWALSRWGVNDVVVEGLAGASTGATRNSRILAEARAAGVVGALQAQDINARPRIAGMSTSRALAAEGAARVRSADILPFDLGRE
ncbi:MAG: DUF389 domain-containing protein [Hyphomonadaceae bacterium]